MLRLAIIGSKETCWPEIARRLRGITLHTDDAMTCDAVACLEAVERGTVEHFLQAGKHVLLSSELCTSTAMLQTPGIARLVVANRERYMPSRQLIRQHLDEGKLGKVGLIRVHRWASPATLLNDFDLVLWYFGMMPTVVYAVDFAVGTQVHLGFAGGGMAMLDSTPRLPARNPYHALTVIGSCGAAYSDDQQNLQHRYHDAGVGAERTEEGIVPIVGMLQAFADTIVGQDSNPVIRSTGLESCPTASWLKVLAIQEAVQQSLRTKQAVALPEGA